MLPRKRKLIKWALWLLVLYTVIGFLILPPIVRSIAVKQLSKQLDREVTIEKIKINPFALSTTVRGLMIKDKDGEDEALQQNPKFWELIEAAKSSEAK